MDTDTDTEMEPDVAELADGLARLLLKGERAVLRQQGTQEGLRRVQIDSNWGWAKRADEINSVRYLDVTCLVFGADHKYLEPIDYDHRISTEAVGVQGAVQHSGDILSGHKSKGRQAIGIDLAALSPAVSELYIVMSVWLGAKLQDITYPSVTMVDRDSRQSLCTYRLEDQPQHVLATHSSVIMCRVFPSMGQWEVEALGQLGQGAADNYAPILDSINVHIKERGF